MDWLYQNVDGFADRRDARKYGSNLLRAGFIRHTVNKVSFSEQCYYIIGDLNQGKCGRKISVLYDYMYLANRSNSKSTE